MFVLSSFHYKNRKLENLVENISVHTLKNAELNIFETSQKAAQVLLRFNQAVQESMIKGKKIMHLNGKPSFGFFPEATALNPTQCLALALSEEKLQEAVDLLNNKGTKENGLEWLVLDYNC